MLGEQSDSMYLESFSQLNDSVILYVLVGETGPREMRFWEEKLLVKHQVTAGNHLVITCFCLLSSDLRSGTGLGRSGSLSGYRCPDRPEMGQAQIPGFYQQPAWIWVCSESLFCTFHESLTG